MSIGEYGFGSAFSSTAESSKTLILGGGISRITQNSFANLNGLNVNTGINVEFGTPDKAFNSSALSGGSKGIFAGNETKVKSIVFYKDASSSITEAELLSQLFGTNAASFSG